LKRKWILAIIFISSLLLMILSYYFWDIPLARYCRTLNRSIIDIAEIVTTVGITRWYLIASAVLFVFFTFIYRKKLQAMRSLFVLVSLSVAGIVLNLIKWLAGRNRPINLFNHGYLGFNYFGVGYEFTSFPSGHAQTIFTVATALAILFPRFGIPLFIIAAAVSATRIILTAHYLSDVIAGALVGIICTLAAKYLFDRKKIQLKHT
jgi:membrane-associated phospholipid phosphatase